MRPWMGQRRNVRWRREEVKGKICRYCFQTNKEEQKKRRRRKKKQGSKRNEEKMQLENKNWRKTREIRNSAFLPTLHTEMDRAGGWGLGGWKADEPPSPPISS